MKQTNSQIRGRIQSPFGGIIPENILGRMKLGIASPDVLINLKTLPDMNFIRFDNADGLRVGALATLDDLFENRDVQKHYPVLAESIRLAASPQLRNAATIGGNLMQHSRCWYYRGRFDCWLKGGDVCYAKTGENEHHAIFGGGPCYSVHLSDPAVALCALEAEVQLYGRFL